MRLRKKKSNFFVIYIFLLVFLITSLFSNFSSSFLLNLPDDFYTNLEEIENLNKDKTLGQFYSADFVKNNLETGEKEDKSGTVVFKLFGLIPIKKVKVEILPEEEVFIGGVPIGLNVTTQGAIVVSNTVIDPQNNNISSHKILKNGDIITKINNKQINAVQDIEECLNNTNSSVVNLEILRNNKFKNIELPYIKNSNEKCKLGVWVKDDISGIGTLTFVNSQNQFAALGHPVTDSSGSNIIPISGGNVYDCSLLGIEKGKTNNPGQLKCLFVQSERNGSILRNTKYGIIGKYDTTTDMIDSNLSAKIGGRLSVKPGKASIISSVSGIRQEYEIEIIKANYQKTEDDKSMIFRVTDKKLIELTGGIIQGMSGSPILQNGKIVGAVTHVFMKDPTKGYGVYADWMLKEMKN